MKDNRPVNLQLHTMRFPVTAIISILHRVSGVFLFLLIPFMLYLFDNSLASEEQFARVQKFMATPFIKFSVWAMVSFLLFHLVAGIRHLLMDFGKGESLNGGRMTAYVSMVIAAVLIIAAAVWIF